MLQVPQSSESMMSATAADGAGFSLPDVVGFLRRQWVVIAAVCAVTLALGVVYLVVTPPQYTSKAQLMIDSRKVQPFAQQPILSELTLDSTLVDSQVEVLKSDAVGSAVVANLKLTEDPEFVGAPQSFFGSLLGALGKLGELTGLGGLLADDEAVSEAELARRALTRFKKNLTVQRVGRTYVLEVSYRSLDRGKAATIANAVAEAYITDQLQANFDATKRASDWLQARIGELRHEAVTADRAVQDYRARNNLIDVGGRLVSDQQLADVNTQLVQARAQTAEMKARLDRILAIDEQGVTDAAVTDSLHNDVISRLRQQYVDNARREAEFSARYGKDHPAVVNLREEMQQIRRATMGELRRIAEAYRSDYLIAKSRQESLEASLNQMIQVANEAKQAGVPLRVLESSAQSYRVLYDSFLNRFAESTQQQSFPKTEARVITPAARGEKSDPKVLLVLAAAAMAGLFGGVGVAFAREQLDRVLKTAGQVEQIVGVECLGVLPRIEAKEVQRHLAVAAALPRPEAGERDLPLDLGMERQVCHSPFSRFTETVRSIKVAADMHAHARDNTVMGVVSALPSEGKSTVAANLAQLLTNGGNRALLIDGDLRHPALTRRMTPKAGVGLLEILSGQASFEDAVWRDPLTKLDFLPAVVGSPIAHTAELISSPAMQRLLADMRSRYKYVVVDLPPLGPVVDARAASELMDLFLLVIEWGQTSPMAVTETLASADLIRAKMLGAVLNKADPAALKRLEAYKGASYYKYYNNYYQSS